MPKKPDTLVELLKQVVARDPAREILKYKQGKEWLGMTAATVMESVRAAALGLYALGIGKGDCVALLAESSALWTISDFAILSIGAINVPIYPTQSVHQVEYILRDCEPKLLFISSARQVKRISAALEAFPELPIVSFERAASSTKVIAFTELEERGKQSADGPGLYDRLSTEVLGKDLASIIYTSGTTGEPKGVMLTHSNIVFDAIAAGEFLKIEPANQMLSFLPLSHVFERMVAYLCLYFGVNVAYSGGIETVASDLQAIRPTLMSTVPRMLERIYGRIQRNAMAAPPLKQKMFRRALQVGRAWAGAKLTGRRAGMFLDAEHRVADRLVFSKVREVFGGRIRRMVSGGAALPTELALVFNGMGVPVLQGYGMTETSPVIACNTLEQNRLGTVGKPLPGVQVKIAEDGEILTRGPHVFQGYFKKPDETRDAFVGGQPGPNSWLKTGDIGYLDGDGFLVITDRKKDLIKTSSGKYVAPQPIENRLSESEYIEQACIVGNNRKYVAALIVPDFEILGAWAKKQGIDHQDNAGLIADQRVAEFVRSEVNRLTIDLADYEKVKRIALLPAALAIESGELTPTLKVRRGIVMEKYKDLVDSLYPDGVEG